MSDNTTRPNTTGGDVIRDEVDVKDYAGNEQKVQVFKPAHGRASTLSDRRVLPVSGAAGLLEQLRDAKLARNLLLREMQRASSWGAGAAPSYPISTISASAPAGISLASIGAVAESSTTTLTPAYPSGIVAGDLLVCATVNKRPGGFEAPNTPAGWSAQSGTSDHGGTGTDGGEVIAYLFYKVADGSETGTLSVTFTGSADVCQGVIARYTKPSGTWSITGGGAVDINSPEIPLAIASGSSATVASGNVVVFVGGPNTDNYTYSSHSFSLSGATFGTVTEQAEVGSTLGTNLLLLYLDAPVTSGSGTATFTCTTSPSGSTATAPCVSGVFLVLSTS